MILVAGVLLLTPGFVTDTLGFLLFVPALRDIDVAVRPRPRTGRLGNGAARPAQVTGRRPRSRPSISPRTNMRAGANPDSPWSEGN